MISLANRVLTPAVLSWNVAFTCSLKHNKHDLGYKRFCIKFCLRDEKIVSSMQDSWSAFCWTRAEAPFVYCNLAFNVLSANAKRKYAGTEALLWWAAEENCRLRGTYFPRLRLSEYEASKIFGLLTERRRSRQRTYNVTWWRVRVIFVPPRLT